LKEIAVRKLSALITCLISICIFVFPVSAEPVKSDAAILVGKTHLKAQKRFWKNKPDMAPRTASRGEEYSILGHRKLEHNGRIIAYILDLSPEGCIVLSSDTDIHPVIAYSLRGRFLMEDAPDNVFLHLLELDMGNRLDALPATSEKLKKKNSALWENYLAQDESIVQVLSSEDVWGPWLETTWYQGYPYNTYCPIDPTTGNRSIVGCAATAMAQIVYFWKYPTSLTFSWDEDHYISNEGKEKEIKIDDDHQALDFPSFDELNQKLVDIKYDGNVDEIAAICFTCGISANMNYSSQGSGTYAYYVFRGYSKLRYTFVDKWMHEEDFYDVLKGDMKEARPAQLHIYSDSSGHAIVADGYRTNWAGESGDFYHLNFGWGSSSPDLIDECWYTLPEGLPAGYNRVGSAAMNIYPSEGPVAYSQSVNTDEDIPVDITLTASDPDGDPLIYTVVTEPTRGTLTGTAPYLVYTPAPNLNGTDSFTFKASDGASDSNVATVSITVNPVNDPPVITSTPVTTATEGVLYTYNVEATDVDTGDVLTYSLTASPTGMIMDAVTGLIQWTPAGDQTGDNEVSVQVEDISEATDTQAFTVAVLNVNDPPVAYSQSVTTGEDTPVDITLTASDPDGDPLTYTVVTEPARGTLTGTAPNLVYTPAPNLNGTDSFTFKASDGASDSNVATVSITVNPVNDPPVVTSTPVTTATEGVLYTYDVEATDVDTGDVLTYSLTASPTGMSMDAATGLIQWIPTGDQTGDNEVSVQVEDTSEATDTQAFTVAVLNVNDPPVAYSQSVTTDEDTPVGMILTASDPDGDPLTYTVVTEPTKGILTGTAPNLVYTPAPNLNGTDSFTFKASDGASDSNIATVSITVNPVNDPPVVTSTPVTTATEGVLYTYNVEATDADTGDVLTYSLTASPTGMGMDAATGLIQWTPTGDQTGDNEVSVQVEDTSEATDTQAFTVAVMNVNDPPVAYSQSVTTGEDTPVGMILTASDPDGDPLTYTVVTEPVRGTLSGTAPYLVYTPTSNLNGSDSFTFKASDGASDSNIATVSITVNPVNDPPVAYSQSVTTGEDTPVDITLTASDPDGDPLTYTVVTEPVRGTLSGTAPYLVYTPAPNLNGSDSFTFKASDGASDSNIATMSITVNPVNDPPVAYSQSVTTGEDTPVDITLTGSDPDGDPLTYTIVTEPTKGILTGTAPYLVYTPTSNLNGIDSFTFKASDGASDSNVATVSITVNPVNDPPVAYSQSVTTDEDTPANIALTGSDTDGDPLTYTVVTEPVRGTLSGTAPYLVYTPATKLNGSDSFAFKASDGASDSNVATVSITVNPVNDPPVAHSQSVTTDEDTPVDITLTGSDPDGDPLTYTVVAEPVSGTLTGTAPNLVYTPAPNLNVTDSFTFKVSDGKTDSDLAIVIITVRAGDFVIRAFNFVDLLVVDPKGREIGKGISTIPSAKYTEVDVDGDGDPDDQIIIPKPMTGNYSIRVVPEPGAKPTDTYTLNVTYDRKSTKLADKVKIKDIPGKPYIFLLTQSFSCKMKPGWSLISLPLQPLDTDPRVVLSSIDGKYSSVRAYDPDTGWSVYAPGTPGDLHKMEPGAGYWIEMDKSGTLTVEGTELDSTAIFLKGGGWNLVGYNSLEPKNAEDCMRCVEGDINSVWSFSPDTSWSVYAPYGVSDLSIMKPGAGYWMEVDRDCIWDVNASTPAAAPLTVRSRMSDISSDRPEIPYSIWGNVEINDENILGRDALNCKPSAILKVDGKVKSSCKLRTVGRYKYSYILHVPAIADSPAQVYIQIGNELVQAAQAPPGEPGQLIRLDLSVRDTPGVNSLYQNYPNPFNPDTWIPYQLKEDASVVIRIYASSGQLVCILNLGRKKAGSYTLRSRAAHWDGKNEAGEHVAGGVYFYTIQAGNFAATKKLVMME
jgi:hypothetical protein